MQLTLQAASMNSNRELALSFNHSFILSPLFQVFLDSPVIVNGVSVRWRGSVNLEKLDGVGGFRFDEDSSRVEDMAMQQQVDSYKHALRDWEDQQARSDEHRAAPSAQNVAQESEGN